MAALALPGLVDLLQEPTLPEGRCVAAHTLACLALTYELKQPIADAALPALSDLLQDAALPEGRCHAAHALGNLAVCDQLG